MDKSKFAKEDGDGVGRECNEKHPSQDDQPRSKNIGDKSIKSEIEAQCTPDTADSLTHQKNSDGMDQDDLPRFSYIQQLENQ